MRNGRHRSHCGGFTYLAVLIVVATIGMSTAGFSELWSQSRQREKEQELLWIGNQFRQAIGLYYQRTPGAVKRFPQSLEELLEDKRYLAVQRYLRRIYVDPMTGKAAWGLVPAPGGGIMGIYSTSERKPLKTAGFRLEEREFARRDTYAGWRFVYEPPEFAQGGPVVGQRTGLWPFHDPQIFSPPDRAPPRFLG